MLNYCTKNGIIRSVFHLLLDWLCSLSQQCSLTIEASVANERNGKLPDFSCQTWVKTACNILPSCKFANCLNLFISRFVIAQYRALMHRVLSSANKLQPQNKIEVAILLLNDIATFTCVLCDFIAHLTFPMRKVFSDKKFNSNHKMFSTGGRWQLNMRLDIYLASLPGVEEE